MASVNFVIGLSSLRTSVGKFCIIKRAFVCLSLRLSHACFTTFCVSFSFVLVAFVLVYSEDGVHVCYGHCILGLSSVRQTESRMGTADNAMPLVRLHSAKALTGQYCPTESK